MEHYRCLKCYIPTSGRERDVDTLQFFPKKIPFPEILTEHYLKQAASDIIHILQNPPSSLPYLQYGNPTNNALFQIAMLLGRATPQPPAWTPILIPATHPPRVQLPSHPPRVPTSVHPPRVQPPTHPPRVPPPVHPPRVPVPTHPPRVPLPVPPPPPMVPITPSLVSIPNVTPPRVTITPPRVQLPHLPSRVQTRSATSKYCSATGKYHSLRPGGESRLLRSRVSQPSQYPRPALQHAQTMKFCHLQANHIYNAQGKKETIDTLLSGNDGAIWTTGLLNELF